MKRLVISPEQLTTHDEKPVGFTFGQQSFLLSLVPRLALVGGFGSGKTFPFCMKAIFLAFMHGAGYRGQLISPTYDMFARVLLPTLRDDIMMKLGNPDDKKSLWDLSKWSPSHRELTFPNGFVLTFGSADKPERLRGSNLAFIGIDEATLLEKFDRVWNSAISRLRRAKTHPWILDEAGESMSMAQLFLCGTPEGMDRIHDKFVMGPEQEDRRQGWKDTHQLIRISTRDNPGADASFISNLMLGIPEALIPAYLDGQHVDVGRGRCYYNFEVLQNVRSSAKYDPGLDLHISWDFNVDPMPLTVHQVMGYGESGQRGLLKTIDEIVLRNSDTPQTCREFISRFGSNGLRHQRRIYVYGDASDAVGVSNYDEIEDYLQGHFPGDIVRRIPNANPRHRRRLKSVNAMAKNARGEVRWIVNPKCRWTIRDCLNQKMDLGGKSKDKKQEADDGTTLGHCSDTLDYVIDTLFPYQRLSARDAMRGSRLTAHVYQ